MIRRGLFGVVVLVSLVVGRFQSARAQDWRQIFSTTLTNDTIGPQTPYFLNVNVGFTFIPGIWFSPGDGSPFTFQFWTSKFTRTTDGGMTWTVIPFFDSIGCSITQLCFVSLQHGYAATITNGRVKSATNSSGIYETVDQGTHWNKISPDGMGFSGVYATSSAIFASEIEIVHGRVIQPIFDFEINGNIIYSRDDGVTWDSIVNVSGLKLKQPPPFQWIYGNRDSLVATVYYTDSTTDITGRGNAPDSTYLIFSTDLGNSWQSTILDPNYEWPMVALHISPHSCNIIRQYLDNQDLHGNPGDTYSFLEATPPYTDWNPSLPHLETTAWIFGNSCALYLSYAGQDHTHGPLQRSNDNGTSWISDGIGHSSGSTPDFDEMDDGDWQNLSVVGYGAVVYTDEFNDEGPVGGFQYWKSTDGGDGTLSASALAPRLDFGHGKFASGSDTLVMSTCAPSSMLVYYQNLSCAVTKLDSISIAGLGPSEYSLTSTNYNDCLSLPDTTFVALTPLSAGTRNITVHANFIDDEYNTIDTTLNVTLIVNSGGTGSALSFNFKEAAIHTAAGDTLNIPVYLSGNTTLDSTSITLPFGIDTEVLWPIGFLPAIPGLSNDTLIFSNGAVNVPLQSDSITLNGETLIGYLRCIVYIADTLATTVTMSSASLTSVNAPCVALSLTTDSVNILINGCGDKTLLQFMKTGKVPLAIQSIVPSPANDAVQINFQNPTASAISYQIFDALGQTRLNGIVASNALSLDVSSMPQGVYFFRAANGTGFSVSSKLVIVR